MITPVNHSCKLTSGSDFNSRNAYYGSDITPVKNNLGVILTLAKCVCKSHRYIPGQGASYVLSEMLKSSLELIF